MVQTAIRDSAQQSVRDGHSQQTSSFIFSLITVGTMGEYVSKSGSYQH